MARKKKRLKKMIKPEEMDLARVLDVPSPRLGQRFTILPTPAGSTRFLKKRRKKKGT